MKSKLNYADRVHVAYALYLAGFMPSYSHDLSDAIIVGYGELRDGLEFEYPLWTHTDNTIIHIGAVEHIIEGWE